MTKNDLFDEVLRTANLNRANVSRFYEGLVDVAMKRLKNDGEFVLPGLGVLKVTTRKAREGRNPRTGEKIRIGRRKGVRFRPYQNVRYMLNPSLAKTESAADEPADPAEPEQPF